MKLLAFDLGAESGRAVLGTLAEGRIGVEEVHRFANSPVRESGHLHWDLPALWRELCAGLKEAAARAGRLAGIGVDTWGVDYALLSPGGTILGRPFHYRDARTDGILEQAFARVPRERIYDATGIQFLQFNTLFQLWAHARDDLGTLDRAERLLLMPDVLRFMLSGATHTEPTIASTTQMYDPRRHEWAWELVEALGIPRRLLPPIEATGSMSRLKAEVARECGLSQHADQCPVISTTSHDTAAAVAAVPARGDRGWCYISSGTWSLMGVERRQPIISPDSMRANFTNEVGFGPSIRFLKNIMGLWLVQECRRAFTERGSDRSYAELTKLAAAASSCEAVVDPDDPPFLAPGDMPGKIERFCRRTNQPVPADEAQMIRCCLESLALTYRRTLEALEWLIDERIDTIHIVGGGSQNELLNQMTADACGRTVLAGPREATAIGNILVQAVALGALPSLAALREVVSRSVEPKQFEPIDPVPWEARYRRFAEVAPA